MVKIKREKLGELYSLISAAKRLYIPAKKAGQTNYEIFTEETEVDLDTLKTVKSAKELYFPQSETLYSVKTVDGKFRVNQTELQKEEFVVFGIKACDIKGIEVLDRVFLSEPVDTFYKARRDHGTTVALCCNEPEESCFCTAFGVDPADAKGDVTAIFSGDYLYMNANTEKGERLISDCASLLEEAKEEEISAEKESIKAILKKLPYADLSLKGWGGEETEKRFGSEIWKEIYKPCLACGTCTFICPTCQCYDLKDYDTGNGVQKYRCWDSCMYSDFTMMAHGNNRTSQMQRFRQRFMHKLVYFPANNDGMYSCVGCGRCVDKCPASTNIIKVIKAFSKEVD